MKINVNEEEILDFPAWKEKVIKNDIPSELFEEDMNRRLRYVIEHKFEQCFNRLEKEWMEKLREDPLVTTVPTDKQELAEMIFARADYKDRSARDLERGIS